MTGSNSRNAGGTGPTTDSEASGGGRFSLAARKRVGTVALFLGGTLLVRALRARTKRRGALQGLLGVGLLAFGVRQRLSPTGNSRTDRGAWDDAGVDGDTGSTGTGTDTATRTAHAVEDTTNPRDVTQEPDVETRTDPDEGQVQFTTDDADEPRSEPQIGDASEGERDSRQRDEGDETAVDLSKTAMADEPNEAVGPQAEQAEPASTEATEPEPSPREDESHEQADEPATEVEDDDRSADEGEDRSPGEGEDEFADGSENASTEELDDEDDGDVTGGS